MIIFESNFFLVNAIVGSVFFLIYAYQFYFIPVSIFRKKITFPDADPKRYAILICARNEENVIGKLIDSIHKQNYPADKIDIFVLADNCTDDTAKICRNMGARVIERENRELVGKGYALNHLIDTITEGHTKWEYEGFFVIDADNLLDKDFVLEMNKAMSAGNPIVAGYRNTKNYADNWISASYGLWFIRESRYLNHARQVLGVSSQCSGTGFVIHRDILKELGGWHYFTLTEDVEFTFAMTAKAVKITYCPSAILYDEQPVKFTESWKQRTRWVKGYFQAYRIYCLKLLKGFIVERRFSCFDMLANTFTGAVITVGLFWFYIFSILFHIILGISLIDVLLCFVLFIACGYLAVFIIGLITTITEWDRIYCPKARKIKYIFTFPFFLITLMVVAVFAPFSRQHWSQIEHNRTMDIDDVTAPRS